jgi:hypothetical protein
LQRQCPQPGFSHHVHADGRGPGFERGFFDFTGFIVVFDDLE